MLFMSWFLGHGAYGIFAPRSGIEPAPSALEGKVLTTGSAGKSQDYSFSVGTYTLSLLPSTPTSHFVEFKYLFFESYNFN